MIYIGVTPSFRLPKSDAVTPGSMPFPLDRTCLRTFEARYALFHGLKALGLEEGDTLLAPSYCCGTEIDPLIAGGIRIRWYGMQDGFSLDFSTIVHGWDEGVRGILVVHYLGFNQLTPELLDFCRAKGMLIIEDCAHAFLSLSERSQPLGSLGDASIFSLRKTLPIPDGGVLFLRDAGPRSVDKALTRPSPIPILFRSLDLMANSAAQPPAALLRLGRSLLRSKRLFQFLGKLTRLYGPGLLNLYTDNYYHAASLWGMSSLTQKLLGMQTWDEIRKRRRDNFRCLLEGTGSIPGVKPLLSSLPDGACPLMFPMVTDNREGVQAALLSHGIHSHPWWGHFHPAVPWDLHPISVKLKKTVLGLPVHQDLTDVHMDRILGALRSLGPDVLF